MNVPLRLAIVFSPLLVWGALYLAWRLGRIPLARFVPWLRAGFVVLLGVRIVLAVSGSNHWSDIVMTNAWGLFGAHLWTTRGRKKESETLISLNL